MPNEPLGARLKRLRERAGLRQTELAELSGIGQSHISAIERGQYAELRTDTANKLASALGITIDELYGESGVRREPATFWDRLERSFGELSPEEQEHVLFIVERIRRSRGTRLIE